MLSLWMMTYYLPEIAATSAHASGTAGGAKSEFTLWRATDKAEAEL